MLQYTSGSTGDPKGVILSHDNLLANIRAMGRAAAVTSSDRFVSWLPLYHDMGLIGAWLATMYHAVPLVLMPPTSFLGRPSRWLWAIHRYRATISAGPNFAYEIAASKVRDDDLIGLDLSSWRLAFNGAEPVRAATLERFAARFAPYGFDRRALTPVYGLAESAVGLTFPPLGRGPLVERIDEGVLAREGRATVSSDTAISALEVVSCGRPLPHHEIRVVDDGGREVPERIEGRIEFRGPSATIGYHRNPDATAKLFRGDWLDTGDVGYIAGGELFLTSRAKDLIKRGGHNIHPVRSRSRRGRCAGNTQGLRRGVRHGGSRERNRTRHRRGGNQPIGSIVACRPARANHGTGRDPFERPGRRSAAGSCAHRPEDLERQDSPRRMPRALRSRACSKRRGAPSGCSSRAWSGRPWRRVCVAGDMA